MSKTPRMSPDQARQYLANVIAAGITDWTSKLPNFGNDTQVVRRAQSFKKMEQAGKSLIGANQAARGHSKTEKPGKASRFAKLRGATVTTNYATPSRDTPKRHHAGGGGAPDHLTDAERVARRAKDLNIRAVVRSASNVRVTIKDRDAAAAAALITTIGEVNPEWKVLFNWTDSNDEQRESFADTTRAGIRGRNGFVYARTLSEEVRVDGRGDFNDFMEWLIDEQYSGSFGWSEVELEMY